VSAVVATGLQWERFSELWLAVLKHPDYNVTDIKGRRVFHTVEFETPEGRRGTVYENWSKEKREKFHNDLLHVIALSQIKCFGASVIASEYDEVASKPAIVVLKHETLQSERFRLFGNRYFFCAYWSMQLAVSEAQRYYPKNARVSYHFEAGGNNYKQPIDLLYDMALKDATQDEYFRFYSAPHFGPKDSAIPLQAADKIAYECAKETSHIADLNPPEQHSEVREGRRQWRQRYAPIYLNALGVDIHLRYWRKEHLEDFFERGERRTALPENED
jgi:hypothetical protein